VASQSFEPGEDDDNCRRQLLFKLKAARSSLRIASPNEIFTAEDLNEEHLAIARTVEPILDE